MSRSYFYFNNQIKKNNDKANTFLVMLLSSRRFNIQQLGKGKKQFFFHTLHERY